MTQEEKNNYTINKWGKCEKERIRKKITSFATNPFISGYLSKATALMVRPKMIVNALAFCF